MASRETIPAEEATHKRRRKRALIFNFLSLTILLVLAFLASQLLLPHPERVALLGAALLWAVASGVILSRTLFPQKVPPQLKSELERLSAENEVLREENIILKRENDALKIMNEDLYKKYLDISEKLSSKERELATLRGEYEALKVSVEAPDLAEWRRRVIEKASLSGRDYTVIYMLVKQADEAAALGYKAYARAILQAVYNLLQDRLVDRKLLLLWEVGERPPIDLQKAVRGSV
jgi:cell division protein FtsB